MSVLLAQCLNMIEAQDICIVLCHLGRFFFLKRFPHAINPSRSVQVAMPLEIVVSGKTGPLLRDAPECTEPGS